MNTSSALAIEKTLHNLDVKAFWHTHLSDLKERLETVSQPTKKAAIRKAIADAEFRVKEIEYMGSLVIGSWVSSQFTNKPGQITGLGYSGKVPEAQVTWWGAKVSVPERPLNLVVLDDDQLAYQWNNDKFPKLVRRFDGLECADLETLLEKLAEAKVELAFEKLDSYSQNEYQLRVNYCNKRIAYFESKLSQPSVTSSVLLSVVPFEISISEINRDGGTQQRVNLNLEVVKEYAEAMRQGDKFPPVKLTYDGTNYWLTDGFHTTEAAWSIGKTHIEAIVTKGSQRDAILASVAVNSDHGLRRSNADKRRAVTTLLEDEEWRKWSNREISRRCKVDHKTVGKIRQDLTGYLASDNPKSDNQIITGEFPSDNPKKYMDKYGNESFMNTQKPPQNTSGVDPNRLSTPEALTINSFCEDQIVRIKSDRSDKRLVGFSGSVAVINQINPASVDLKFWGRLITNVSPNDIEVLDEQKLPPISFCPADPEDYRIALTSFDSPEDMLKSAIAIKKFL